MSGVLVEVVTGASWNLMSLHPGAWCVVVHAPNWIVPVILLPVSYCAMRGVLPPGVPVCGDWGILESDDAPSWCMGCGGAMFPTG